MEALGGAICRGAHAGVYNAPSYVSELSAGVDLIAGSPSFVVCMSDLEKAVSEGKISKLPQKQWQFDAVIYGKMRKFFIGRPPQIDEIMKELNIEESTLEKMTFRDIGETLSAYYINLQNQMILQSSSDAPLSLNGQWLVGKDVSPELAIRVARIQSQRMQEEKIKMGFYG